MSQQELDLVNRDPNNLNDHVKVMFEDVFGEPEGAHSIDCVWNLSYKCFNCTKGCCYKIMTLFCGCPLAMMWGCEFAMITFNHVWQVTPCIRCFQINLGCLQKFYGTITQCCIAPCCEAFGLCFSNIKVQNSSG